MTLLTFFLTLCDRVTISITIVGTPTIDTNTPNIIMTMIIK